MIPQPETVITEGDEVLALAMPDAEADVRESLVGEPSAPPA